MECIFVFGRDPELSFLELISYLKARHIQHKVFGYSNIAAVVDLPELDFKEMIKKLGGVVKIAKVIDAEEELYIGSKNKLKFAISNYGSQLYADVREAVKEKMKEARLKAVLKNSKRGLPYLSPSEVQAYNLLDEEEGFELVLYKDYVGKTIAAFDPEEQEKRDTQRPLQRFEQAISIRLAKILINLAGSPGKTLLDPFCGYGIILQEALLLDMNAVGIDIDKHCVDSAIKNLQWTKKKYRAKGWFKVINADSRELSKFVGKVDCVATEPYLGPVLRKRLGKKEATEVLKQVSSLYFSVLQELRKVVNGRISILVPRIRTSDGGAIGFDFSALLHNCGFVQSQIFKGIKFPIIYTYPNSFIDREIWVIEPKNGI